MKKWIVLAVAAVLVTAGGVTTGLEMQRPGGVIKPRAGFCNPNYAGFCNGGGGGTGTVPTSGSTTSTTAVTTTSPTTVPPGSYLVPASFGGTPIPADCSSGVATVLNNWIASIPDHSTLLFAPTGCYALGGALKIINRNSLTFNGQGAAFQLNTTEGQAGTKYIMPWYVNGGTNITFENMSLKGTSTAAATCVGDACGTSKICGPSGAFEFQDGIEYAGTNEGNVSNVSMSQSCGDFIDFYPYCDGTFTIGGGCGGSNVWTDPAENITVNGGTYSVAGRQGMSVVDGEAITIENTSQSWVGQDGIDIEPDATLGYTGQITVTQNTFTGIGNSMFNESGGGDLGSGNLTVTNNTWTAAVACAALGNVNASGVSPTPSGITFSGNTGAIYGLQYSLTDVNNVTITGNINTYTQGTYCFNYAVQANTVNNINVSANTFAVYPAVGGLPNQPTAIFQSLATVTGTVTNCGNQDVNGTNQPTYC